MNFKKALTLDSLPPYLFAEMDEKKKKLIERGVDIISLGVGDPDQPTPQFVIDRMKKAIENPLHHQYPFGKGIKAFRDEIANWYRRKYNVKIDSSKEVYPLIGSKEGLTHLSLAFVNPNEIVLCPEPGYPAYWSSTLISHAKTYQMPLRENNNFFPDFDNIPIEIKNKARLMFLNSPNNPTSAVYTENEFKKAIEFAHKYNIIIAHDAAYSQIYYDGKQPKSFLEIDGAMEVGVEFQSLSKSFNMTGWRIAFIAGNQQIISGLASVKDNFDSGVFGAIQEAGMIALRDGDSEGDKIREYYQKRRDLFIKEMQSFLELKVPKATFYIWAKTPKGLSSAELANIILDKAGVVITPGNGFGPSGEGYIRFSLTVNDKILRKGIDRLKNVLRQI